MKPRSGALLLVVLAAWLGGAAACCGADYVWWEGEKPAETNFPATSWFAPSTFEDTRHLLSGGDWLSASGKRGKDELFARYRLDLPADGRYNLWARKFWQHGPFRWRFDKLTAPSNVEGRFDDALWQQCGRDVGLADSTELRQHVCANWVHLGSVTLTKGRHVFELRLLAREGEEAVACFDCFLLTPGPFMPRGQLKPDERSGLADEGYFAYEPAIDDFRPEALLDLRGLNEAVAGERGFVRRDGERFLLGDGRPVRFWAVNVGPNNIRQSRESVDYLARRLAKLGVNMVRCHGPIFDASAADPATVDPRTLDDLFYLVAALKKQGIYTTISFYFPLWFDVKPPYGIGGYEALENKKPFALLYFNPRMQNIHRSWARALLTTKNPYTGVPLAREPAVAIVEIVNEDSYFFWTFSKKNIPPEHWRQLERLFAQWLTKRYGSLDKAFAAWGRARSPDDDAASGRAAIFEAWHMTRDGLKQGGADKLRRMSDQARFLADSQRAFYAAAAAYVKKDLGAGSLVSASNWTTADPLILDALERYTYTACDVIDRHGYFGGRHEGDGAAYSVRVGHTFDSLAAVNQPGRLPLQPVQVQGFPQIVSEVGWTNPNRYLADATLLASACGALQGLDGLYFFAVGSDLLCDASMTKFPVSCPAIAGTFPAAALQYRRGDLKEAPAAARQSFGPEDLFALTPNAAAPGEALDALRQKDVQAQPGPGPDARTVSRAGAQGFVDPLAFYVGPVQYAFGGGAGLALLDGLDKRCDRARGLVTSATDELVWDFKRGLVKVNTPRSQGAAGFLAAAGKIDLLDVSLESKNEYASLWAIALDDKPLAESRKILIQAMTEEQPYGFRAAGGRITALGGWPFGVKKIDATVWLRLKGGGQPRVVALDENGCATAKPVTARGGEGGAPLMIRLAPDAIYHVVSR